MTPAERTRIGAKRKNVLAAILAALLIAGSAYVLYVNFKAHESIRHGR